MLIINIIILSGEFQSTTITHFELCYARG